MNIIAAIGAGMIGTGSVLLGFAWRAKHQWFDWPGACLLTLGIGVFVVGLGLL